METSPISRGARSEPVKAKPVESVSRGLAGLREPMRIQGLADFVTLQPAQIGAPTGGPRCFRRFKLAGGADAKSGGCAGHAGSTVGVGYRARTVGSARLIQSSMTSISSS